MENNVMMLMNVRPRMFVHKIVKIKLEVMIAIVSTDFIKETIKPPAYQDLVII